MTDDYEDEIRRQDYERLFGTPEEREEEARESAERAARIKRDETLEWARQRAEERERPLVVERTNYARSKQEAVDATKYWHGYIREQLDARDRALVKAVADAVVAEERQRARSDADIKTIVFDVRDRFDAMETRASEVEALRATIDRLIERIARLEAAPVKMFPGIARAGLKVAG